MSTVIILHNSIFTLMTVFIKIEFITINIKTMNKLFYLLLSIIMTVTVVACWGSSGACSVDPGTGVGCTCTGSGCKCKCLRVTSLMSPLIFNQTEINKIYSGKLTAYTTCSARHGCSQNCPPIYTAVCKTIWIRGRIIGMCGCYKYC